MSSLKRTVGCGLVAEAHLGTQVALTGWVHRRRDHGGLIFVDLRDRTGMMQLVFSPEAGTNAHQEAQHIRSEYVLWVQGTVVERSPETVNVNMPTGRYELKVTSLSVLNKAKNLPFQLDEADIVDEEIRLTYRYLDRHKY